MMGPAGGSLRKPNSGSENSGLVFIGIAAAHCNYPTGGNIQHCLVKNGNFGRKSQETYDVMYGRRRMKEL